MTTIDIICLARVGIPIDTTVVQQVFWPLVPTTITNVDLKNIELPYDSKMESVVSDYEDYTITLYRFETNVEIQYPTVYLTNGIDKGKHFNYRKWLESVVTVTNGTPSLLKYLVTKDMNETTGVVGGLYKEFYSGLEGVGAVVLNGPSELASKTWDSLQTPTAV